MFRVSGLNIAGTHGCRPACSGLRALDLSFANRPSLRSEAASSYRATSPAACPLGGGDPVDWGLGPEAGPERVRSALWAGLVKSGPLSGDIRRFSVSKESCPIVPPPTAGRTGSAAPDKLASR